MSRHDMMIYDERQRFPPSLFGLAMFLAGPFVYLSLSRVLVAALKIYQGCTFNNFSGHCPTHPEIDTVFTAFCALHVIYDRLAKLQPETKYVPLLLYILAVVVVFVPFVLRNYRAGFREFFLLAFLASGALGTLVLK